MVPKKVAGSLTVSCQLKRLPACQETTYLPDSQNIRARMRDSGTRGGPSRAGHWEEGGAKPNHDYSRSRTLYHGGTPLEGTKNQWWTDGSACGRVVCRDAANCQNPRRRGEGGGWGGVDGTGALPTGKEAACLPEDCGEDA